ncbi:cytidylate kinase [Clostridium sp. CAG:921]|nr:cytidylate kinase [Clostridium sp. CAG:921]
MGKKHIITIAGDLASGKGTASKILCDKLGYTIYRNGEYFRKLAKEANMSVTEFNVYVEDHPEIDKEIEKSAEKYAKEHDNLVIDARLGWYVVPDSFKLYLKVNLDVAASRAFNDPDRKSTEKFDTIEKQKQDLKLRYELENKRYFDVYGVRKDDMSNYDFVLDTTNLSPEEVVSKILEEYSKWLEN